MNCSHDPNVWDTPSGRALNTAQPTRLRPEASDPQRNDVVEATSGGAIPHRERHHQGGRPGTYRVGFIQAACGVVATMRSAPRATTIRSSTGIGFATIVEVCRRPRAARYGPVSFTPLSVPERPMIAAPTVVDLRTAGVRSTLGGTVPSVAWRK